MKPYNLNRVRQIPKYDEIRILLAAETLVKMKHAEPPTKPAFKPDQHRGEMKRCLAFDNLRVMDK